jgi:hypothetical protein
LTEDERMNRGRQAAHELRVTEEAFAAVRQYLVDAMVETSPENEAGIMKRHQAVQVLDMVRKALILVVADGDIVRAAQESGLNRPN